MLMEASDPRPRSTTSSQCPRCLPTPQPLKAACLVSAPDPAQLSAWPLHLQAIGHSLL